MKKLFLLITILASSVAAFADDETEMINLTLNIDNASNVSVSFNGVEAEDLQDGVNQLEIFPWSNMSISAVDGCTLVSVTDEQGVELTVDNNSVSKFISDTPTSLSYTVVTDRNMEKINFTIEIDNPAAVKIVDKNFETIKVEKGSNPIELESSRLPLIIDSAEYGTELYRVSVNEEPIPYYYGYLVTPVDNCILKIEACFPDIAMTVDFKIPENLSDFFTMVTVDNNKYADYKNGFEAKCGSKIQLFYNPACWKENEDGESSVHVKINDVIPSWFGPGYSFTLKEATTIEVEGALLAEMISITLDIDNPQNVTVYRGNEYYRDVLELKPGENTVELPEEDARVVVMANQSEEVECGIEGVTINGRPKNVEYNNYIEINNLDAGDIVKVFTKGYSVGVGTDKITGSDETLIIYTIDGKRVPVTERKSLKTLSKGIYIVNGKKMLVF